MTTFFTLLPLYLFGNLHCLGMCGPLVFMLGQHKYRHLYFFGRLLSYSLAGMIAGEMGAISNIALANVHLPLAATFLFGSVLLYTGMLQVMGWNFPLSPRFTQMNHYLSCLLLQDRAWTTFLFGFFTVILPCGQTLIVFTACALAGDPWIGLFNGFALALFTSPSLWLSMQSHTFLKGAKEYYSLVVGGCSILIGVLAFCRGLAEMQWMDHWVLNEQLHLVIY